MTEQEWLMDDNPGRWLYPDRMQAMSERKLRLFCAACCRRVWHLLPDGCRSAVEVAEAYSDGRADRDVLLRSSEVARGIASDADGNAQDAADASASAAEEDIRSHAFPVTVCASKAAWRRKGEREAEEAAQATLLRDIFGNPFRPVIFSPSWLTPTVVGIATAIYADRAFDRLPILADALQDAGCENDEILSHCRSEGPHVRGCWVVDLLTGRK
ncbi:hypothetical protein [Limnoglobus roseus]|uniref:SMI1/KNR4 family protein n=1 Tax=Limnoglobus roseus TaxID=2598579 RepID=A0A5C1AIR8_9BACT|nr:hypothetical protein [Limnoglobus roseus]QEL19061.1 hypothetical protein PX52LOC_06118 [Limnoglobus roseus]